jgi:biotin transport system substrate-specific component
MALTVQLHTAQSAWVDRLRASDASISLQVVSIVTFALLTAAGAQIRLYLWEVPFTLQTVAVYGSGLFLGWRNGLLSQILYISLGMFLPVYAGDGFGAAYLLAAASAGYVLAFPIVSALAGHLSKEWNTLGGSVLSLFFASLALFTVGVVWLHFAAGHATWFESLDKGWLRFIPIDLAKILFVGLVYSGLRRVR